MLAFSHILVHPYNHVQVVGHDAEFPHLHIRVEMINLQYFFLHDGSSKT